MSRMIKATEKYSDICRRMKVCRSCKALGKEVICGKMNYYCGRSGPLVELMEKGKWESSKVPCDCVYYVEYLVNELNNEKETDEIKA